MLVGEHERERFTAEKRPDLLHSQNRIVHPEGAALVPVSTSYWLRWCCNAKGDIRRALTVRLPQRNCMLQDAMQCGKLYISAIDSVSKKIARTDHLLIVDRFVAVDQSRQQLIRGEQQLHCLVNMIKSNQR